MENKKNSQKEKEGISGATVAGIAAAVVGAGVAVAATKVLSNKKNRKKVTYAFFTAKEKAVNLVRQAGVEIRTIEGELESTVAQKNKEAATKATKTSSDRSEKKS